jgi:hypothetical protein
VTLTEVMALLDPPIPRGTLGRLVVVERVRPIGVRPAVGPGRPGHAYRLNDLLRVHSRWAKRRFAKVGEGEANSALTERARNRGARRGDR